MRPLRFVTAGAFLLSASMAGAQESTERDSTIVDRGGLRSAEVWFGYSHSSTSWALLGDRAGFKFGLAGMRLNHRISLQKARAIYYTVDFFPVALVSPPLRYQGQWYRVNPDAHGAVYGAGISPIGFTRIIHPDRMMQLRFGATGGCLLFQRRVPTESSTAFNFTATLEGGVQFLSKQGNGIVAVYRLHHLSNAGTGYDNSGLANHIFSLGARWR